MNKKIVLIVLMLLLTGCAVHLLPQIGPDIKISPSGLIAEQTSEGITVAVDTGKMKFSKFDKYTPVFLVIRNDTDSLISFEYKDFTLKDEANNIFNPISVKGFFGNADSDQYIKKTAFSYSSDNRSFILLAKGKGADREQRGGYRGHRRYYYDYYPYWYFPYSPYEFYDLYGNRFNYPFPYNYNYFYYDYNNSPFYDFSPYNFGIKPYMPYSTPYREKGLEVFDYPLPMDILPHREVSGYLYFPQILKKAKGEIKLSVSIKKAKKVMEFAFKIK